MTRFNHRIWIAALGAGAAATLAVLPRAHAELVYENGATEPSQYQAQVDDREALRQTLQTSEKAQATLQAQPPVQVQTLPPTQAPVAAAPAPVITAPAVAAPAPVAAAVVPAAAAPVVVVSQPATTVADASSSSSMGMVQQAPDTQNLSRSEMLRRERMREELKNEDVLQTRLEELRLRDEEKRTSEILAPVPGATDAVPATATAAPALQAQAVVAPVTEHPGQPAVIPVVPVGAQPAQQTGVQYASLQSTSSMDQTGAAGVSTAKTGDDHESADNKTTFGLTARGGLSNMVTSNIGYSISPQFSAGFAASMVATDYLSLELGYTYSQYAVSMMSTNPIVQQFQSYGANPQSINMNQNVFDFGAKLYVLSSDSRIRPFVTGGLGYAKSYINYSQQVLNFMNSNPALQGMGTDYDLSQYLGYVGAGMDVKITRSISLGVDFRYYDVLASSQNNDLNNYAFYNSYAYSGMTADKQYVGGSLASAGFYSVLAGLTFNM